MRILTLALKEIGYRYLNFLLSLLAVAVGAAVFLAAGALLKSSGLKTDAIIATRARETRKEMADLENQIRKSMKGLGFNIYIFPEGQKMSEVYEKGFASRTMPEDYVEKLAKSPIFTVNHLLPTLTRRITWPEQERTIILIGIRGEVPIAHKSPKQPLIDPVDQGNVVVGFELHRALGLKQGDRIHIMEKEFTVKECHPERGTRDDITVWMNLSECQELLGKEGLINAILALQCNCATVDRLGEVRRELQAILPGTQIIEKGSKALARAEARISAGKTARRQIEAIRRQREELERKRESLAAVLVPVIGLACLGGVCLLAFLNVRERTAEVGIMMAVGIKPGTVLSAFLIKACLVGLLGGLLGLVLARAVVSMASDTFFEGYAWKALVPPMTSRLVLVVMPLLAAAAAWLPAFRASQRDPAEVLRDE
jgi:ABC-type lipoprotein release transport system permease subunit